MTEASNSTTTTTTNTNNCLSWVVYIALVLVRIVLGPFLPGYVHPDEFFQGGQELWFGCPPATPWEFAPNNALRSVVPPTLMTWLPLRLYTYTYSLLQLLLVEDGQRRSLISISMGQLSGWEVWIVPRVACALLSIVTVDGSVWALSQTRIASSSSSREKSAGVPISVLLLASAWPTMVLLNRPFSNSMETYVLALLMQVVLLRKRGQSSSTSTTRCILAGVLCALGLFTRFTFVFFAIPIMLHFLHHNLLWQQTHGGLSGWLVTVIFKVLVTGLSFLIVAAGIVHVDTEFYSSRQEQQDNNEGTSMLFVLTPWNALSYNSKVSNLKDHGLHPRWTHALVNMFLLYGPMTLMAYYLLLCSTISSSSAKWTSKKKGACSDEQQSQNENPSTSMTVVSKWVIVFGLSFLSVAPHQEPRFLLPLLVPLVLLLGDDNHAALIMRSKLGIGIWIVFNTILLLLFGGLHQAGVVPSLLAVGSTSSLMGRQPSAMIYFHTYMPPTFLTRPRGQVGDGTCEVKGTNDEPTTTTCQNDYGSSVCRDIRMVDLNGSNLSTLRDTLATELSCSVENVSATDEYIHLAMPPLKESLDGSLWSFAKECDIPGYDCQRIWNYNNPHLTTEDPPSYDDSLQNFYQGLAFHVYELSCRR
jgi:phosphatidylinositol glycan class Z